VKASREIVWFFRLFVMARQFLAKCEGMVWEGKQWNEGVCFGLLYFYLFRFVHILTIRQGMLSEVDEGLGDGVLANYNGMKFRLNDVVDVMVGTRVGVRGNKTEPIKARFKGVVETVRGVEVLCRPLVGSGKGRCPEFPRDSVFKVSAFGVCVLGTRTTRFFSKLQPTQQDRYTVYDLLQQCCSYICLTFLVCVCQGYATC
jgi:hypothetical protein